MSTEEKLLREIRWMAVALILWGVVSSMILGWGIGDHFRRIEQHMGIEGSRK